MKKTDSSIDLHCHTTASDGAFTPTQIVERAIKREITHLAISDHDTTLGIKEAQEAALKNYPGQIQIIPAIQASTSFLNKQIPFRLITEFLYYQTPHKILSEEMLDGIYL